MNEKKRNQRAKQINNLNQIKKKVNWIVNIINQAINNYENEGERFVCLAQTKVVLRQQVLRLCTGRLEQHSRVITFINDAIGRTAAKNITINQFISFKEAVIVLAQREISATKIEQIEKAMFSI